MKLSKLIEFCQFCILEHGDHEITKRIEGPHTQFKPIKMGFYFEKDGLVKKKTQNSEQEMIVKKKQDSWALTMAEDID